MQNQHVQYYQQPPPMMTNNQYPQTHSPTPSSYPPQQTYQTQQPSYPPQQYQQNNQYPQAQSPPPSSYPPQQQYAPQQHAYPPPQQGYQQTQPQSYAHPQYPPHPQQQSYPPQQGYPPHPQQAPQQQYPPQNYPPQQQYGYAHPPIKGARGDGASDDTAAIQAAINNTPAGGQLFIPQGQYSIRSQLKIQKPIIIIGNGGTIQCDLHSNGWGWGSKIFMISVKTDGCTFDGVQFYNKAGNEGTGFMIVEGNNFNLMNCVIDNFYEGIWLGKMVDPNVPQVFHSHIQITNNKFLNIHGVTGGSIAHGDAVCFFGCTDVTVARNIITAAPNKTPRNGINSGPEGYIRSTRITFAENTVLGDWDYPLTTEWGTNCQIINNTVDGKCVSGIIERGDDIVVSGNKINVRPGKKEDSSGINFYGVDNGTIANNTITGAAKYGIMCVPSHETKKGNNIQIMDNNIDGNFFYGLYFGSTNQTKVFRNNIRTTSEKDSCSAVHGYLNKNLVCEDNQIQIPNGTAFIYSGTQGGSILNNKLTNSKYGAYLGKDTAAIQILNNDFACTTGNPVSKHAETRDIQMP